MVVPSSATSVGVVTTWPVTSASLRVGVTAHAPETTLSTVAATLPLTSTEQGLEVRHV